MKKPVIGIITWNHVEDRENPFKIYTKFSDNFPKRVIEAGGVPLGILFPEDKFIKEELDLCDGFLLHGGSDISSSQVMAIKYILDSKKPVLGICLGIQTLAAFQYAVDNYGDSYQKIKDNYINTDSIKFLDTIDNHDKVNPFNIKNIDESKHKIILEKDNRLYKIFKNDISMPSLHNYIIKKDLFINSRVFRVVGRSEEGDIEAIEGLNRDSFVVGVQFHPELESENIKIFEELIQEAKKS